MDDYTKHLLDRFLDFLTKEICALKEFKMIQFRKWSLHDVRVTIEVLVHDEHKKIFFDIREIKENEDRFMHLLNNAKDQLTNLIVER